MTQLWMSSEGGDCPIKLDFKAAYSGFDRIHLGGDNATVLLKLANAGAFRYPVEMKIFAYAAYEAARILDKHRGFWYVFRYRIDTTSYMWGTRMLDYAITFEFRNAAGRGVKTSVFFSDHGDVFGCGMNSRKLYCDGEDA